MQEKVITSCRPLAECSGIVPTERPLAAVCQLIYSISGDFQIKPEIFRAEYSNELVVIYPDASLQCDDFVEAYGPCLAALSDQCQITAYGFYGYLEEGELTVEPAKGEEGAFVCVKKSVTGREFNLLSAVKLRFQFERRAELNFIAQVADSILPERPVAAVCAKWADVFDEEGLFEKTEFSLFRYLFFETPEDSEVAMLTCLSVEQIKEVWIQFLQNRRDTLELTLFYQRLAFLAEDTESRLMIALHLALSQLEIGISYPDGEFRVADRDGIRMWFDFSANLDGEKLFLKLLFPAVRETAC